MTDLPPKQDQQPGYVPPSHLIDEGNDLLHDLQKILSNLGTDERRNSPEFQQIMGIYKNFGADLHQAKRKADAAKPPPQKATTIHARTALPAPLPLPRFEATLGPTGKPGAISMGEEVGYLQRLLTHLGFEVEESEDFDRPTLLAVQEFQKAHGLEPSGLVGVDMRQLLNQMVTG